TKKRSSSLAVVWGRRRIGKSRLVDEFIKDKKVWKFYGLPPDEETNAQEQINIFMSQMADNIGIPHVQVSDWEKAFKFLSSQAAKEKKLVIVFDEITWMGSEDHNFLPYLKTEWDRSFSKHPNLIFILCGSVSNWIEENILSSTGFFGRISLT